MQHFWECLTLADVSLCLVCMQVCLGLEGDRSTCPTAAPCVRGYGARDVVYCTKFCTVLYYVVCAHVHVCLHVCIFESACHFIPLCFVGHINLCNLYLLMVMLEVSPLLAFMLATTPCTL